MKNMNKFKSILCVLLCVCMIACVFVSGTSAAEDSDTVSVLRFVDSYKAGVKITKDHIETVTLPRSDVPLNAITDETKVIDKYINAKVFKGEFIFAGKLTATDPNVKVDNEEYVDFLLINEYASIGSDITEVLQKLIDDNPGRTIYFPDGQYLLSNPIKISGDPAKKVSLKLSNYAKIKVGPSWKGGDSAMIIIGEDTGATTTSTSAYIMGGILDGFGKTTAIDIKGGRDIFVSNVAINNVTCGIKVASGKIFTDVENVNIYGTDMGASVGVEIAGEGNTFTSVRVSNVKTGFKVSGTYNTLRACFVYSNTDNSSGVAYEDTSAGNSFDSCTSRNFGTGFLMNESTRSLYVCCNVVWTAKPSRQCGFKSNGMLNSIIKTCAVDTKYASEFAAYLEASSGGAGQVLYPVLRSKSNLTNNNYESYRVDGLEIAK